MGCGPPRPDHPVHHDLGEKHLSSLQRPVDVSMFRQEQGFGPHLRQGQHGGRQGEYAHL